MAIRGALREASLPDVLQLLAMGRKTGCLHVSHRQAFGSIYFDRGRIAFASIVNRRDRLGDVLVQRGLLTADELAEAIAAQARTPSRRLGEILLERRLLTREELHAVIKHQIEEAVYSLFTWTEGTFAFEPDEAPQGQDILVSIHPEALLLEGARRVDEWSVIAKKITGPDLVFSVDRAHLAGSGVTLTPEQELLVPLLDGVRDLSALADASGLDDFGVARALYGLVTAGFARCVGRSRAAEGRDDEGRVSEARNLGVAFYRTGMLDDAAREFRRVLERRPGDAQAEGVLGLIALREGRPEQALERLLPLVSAPGATAAAMVNAAQALQAAGRLDEAEALLARAEGGAPDDPMVRQAQADLAMRRRDPAAADACFRAAGARWGTATPPACWFHGAALAAALGGDLARAQRVLEDGLAAYPRAAVLHNNLAAVLERSGRHAEALAAAERGQLEDASVAPLHKNVGDLQYRAGRFDEALESYQRAVRIAPQLGPDTWFRIGNLRLRRGEPAAAIRAWEQVLALDPAHALARRNLAGAAAVAPAGGQGA